MTTRIVVSQPGARFYPPQQGDFLLKKLDWNDWFEYHTLYKLLLTTAGNDFLEIGNVKVARQDMDNPSPTLPEIVTEPGILFSVGQDASYYMNLWEKAGDQAEVTLRLLGDISADSILRNQVWERPITQESLLRSIPAETVRGQFFRLARNGEKLKGYCFNYTQEPGPSGKGLALDFHVEPKSTPPTNIHVLIGRNGVGKSTLLREMAQRFLKPGDAETEIVNVVYSSFSAFDRFEMDWMERDDRDFHYIGLLRTKRAEMSSDHIKSDETPASDLKSAQDLTKELRESFLSLIAKGRADRLAKALDILENDPVFAAWDLSRIVREQNENVKDEHAEPISDIYRQLSSGHKIVLLSTIKLVDTVEEKTLLLLDEPESHLHPPLLSAFCRAISELLTHQNGLAIVATHSPVVVQEVPRSCVWRIARSGDSLSAGRPTVETFGQNVGALTNEVFGLEVSNTGFHELLNQLSLDESSYENALARLGGQLGFEGRSILRANFASKHASA